MSRNPKATKIWIANVSVPGGYNTIFLADEREAHQYDADPDAFAGWHFGLSKIDYLQWVELDGAPLCGHRTKGGDLCRNTVGRIQLKAKEWKARHRKVFCAHHRKEHQ